MRRLLFLAPAVVLVVLLFGVLLAPAQASPPLGEGWIEQRTADVPSGTLYLNAIACADASHVFAVGDTTPDAGSTWSDRLVSTSDGGSTWTVRTFGSTGHLNDVFFLDSTHGWMVGEKLWATVDGGVTWNARTIGTETNLRQVVFVDAAHGWVLGDKLWATGDGGGHWTPSTLEWTPSRVWFSDALNGCITTPPSATSGYIGVYRTSDGGATWTPNTDGVGILTSGLGSMYFSDLSHGWIAGDTIWVTTDGGASWDYQSSHESLVGGFSDVFFLDHSRGWAVGQTTHVGTQEGISIFGTNDGGTTWVPQLATSWGVYGVCFADTSHGWALGSYGQILYTRTSGWPPPMTTATGVANGKWYNKPISLLLSSTPQPPGTSVVSLGYALQGVSQTVPGSSATVPVPVDAATHLNDDLYTLTYFATDNLAHEEWAHTLTFGIDTRRPTTKAPYAATARRGYSATLKYKVVEVGANGGTATVTIKVKNRAGKVVKTLGPAVKTVNAILSWRFTVPRTWRAGTYRFYVYGRDAAGNRQANVASNRLLVR
jgi:photosystem II stability/assembly factor-like uncharacterized protein